MMEFPMITVKETVIGEKNSVFLIPEITLKRYYAPDGTLIDERIDFSPKGAAILKNIAAERNLNEFANRK